MFGDIRDQGRRAGEVIERVRALAGKRPLERQALDMNEVAGEIVTLVRGEARRRGVTLRAELVPSLPAIDADRVSLQQVMLNLMLNGMDAMDQRQDDERRLVVRTRQLADAVEVAVSDTGHGIPADRLPRLFDAFFTTKKEGLGLGLAIARSIVEAHGGRIWAEDHDGRGATFHLTLPALPLH
jgi:signal transduction histidine kinase